VIFYSTSSKQHVIEEHLNLDKIKNLLSKKKESFQLPPNFNFNDFRQLANGLFQAEGYIGCRIRPGVGKVFFPVFNLVQNFSEESLNFFITLWIVLEKKCSLNVRFSSSGKLILILSSENWKNISYLKYYFSLCYGEKYINFAKLEDIRKLSLSDIKTNIGLAVALAYNLSLVGNPKVVKLEDILSKLGLDKINTPAPTTQSGAKQDYSDNKNLPTILFFIGFIIGDGVMHIRLRKTASGSINIIPLIVASQVATKYNKHFMELLEKLFKSLNIPIRIKNNKDSYLLILEGKEIVFNKVLQLLNPYSHLFFWKSANLELFNLVNLFMITGIHLNLKGLNRLLELCFSYSNDRINTLTFWKEIANIYYNKADSNNLSRNHLIRPVYCRNSSTSNKNIVAWLVFSPLKTSLGGKLVFKSKQFLDLNEAIAYRDSKITTILNDIESEIRNKK
jgi:hypothetical protein